jgi:hypothetical protein
MEDLLALAAAPRQSATRNYAAYLLGILLRPSDTVKQLLADPNGMRHGLYTVLMFAGSWWIAVMANDSAARQFSWEFLYAGAFVFAGILMVFISYSGCVQLLCKPLGGTGSFEHTIAVVGLTLFPYWVAVQIPAWLLGGGPPWPGRDLNLWTLLDSLRWIAGSIWAVMVQVLAVRRAQGLTGRRATAVVVGLQLTFALLGAAIDALETD